MPTRPRRFAALPDPSGKPKPAAAADAAPARQLSFAAAAGRASAAGVSARPATTLSAAPPTSTVVHATTAAASSAPAVASAATAATLVPSTAAPVAVSSASSPASRSQATLVEAAKQVLIGLESQRGDLAGTLHAAAGSAPERLPEVLATFTSWCDRSRAGAVDTWREVAATAADASGYIGALLDATGMAAASAAGGVLPAEDTSPAGSAAVAAAVQAVERVFRVVDAVSGGRPLAPAVSALTPLAIAPPFTAILPFCR